MLLSAVSVLVIAQWSSEIPEGLMNNSVYNWIQQSHPLDNNTVSARQEFSRLLWDPTIYYFAESELLISLVIKYPNLLECFGVSNGKQLSTFRKICMQGKS